MNDLNDVRRNYKRLQDEELRRLALQPEELRLEVIPVLQEELLSRGQTHEALLLTEFLVKSKERAEFTSMSLAEVKELVHERLALGESLESIKMHLRDYKINVFDIIDNDSKLKTKAFDYIIRLKREGFEDAEIDEKLKETFLVEKDDIEMLKTELKKNGRKNLIFGYSFFVIAFVLFVLSLAVGGRITIGGVFILVLGILRIVKGHEQSK